jgi:hypothetical protein
VLSRLQTGPKLSCKSWTAAKYRGIRGSSYAGAHCCWALSLAVAATWGRQRFLHRSFPAQARRRRLHQFRVRPGRSSTLWRTPTESPAAKHPTCAGSARETSRMFKSLSFFPINSLAHFPRAVASGCDRSKTSFTRCDRNPRITSRFQAKRSTSLLRRDHRVVKGSSATSTMSGRGDR